MFILSILIASVIGIFTAKSLLFTNTKWKLILVFFILFAIVTGLVHFSIATIEIGSCGLDYKKSGSRHEYGSLCDLKGLPYVASYFVVAILAIPFVIKEVNRKLLDRDGNK